MEQLLHYCWKHKLFPLEGLQTTDGQPVEVIDPGLHNLNAGPDFFNAKVKIDGTLWVGNVEIHDKSSDWFAHGHEKDPHYNNTILHVAGLIDCNVRTQSGITPPQVQLSVPDQVRRNYDDLIKTDTYPPCYKIIPSLSRLTVHSWMSALEAERLERKTKDIRWRAEHCDGSWESAYFVTMARNYGFGINSEPMEQWAFAMPLTVVAHHRDDLFQIEALFMGQAGLLNPESIPERHRDAAIADDYFQKMRREYQFLAHKYSLSPIDHRLWRFLRLRPQNFPHIRISQLANLYYQNKTDLSRLAEAETLDAAKEMLATQVTPYWQTHYAFGCESAKNEKHLSASSVNLLLINTVVPMLFAYGRHRQDDKLCDRAFDFLESLRAEDNTIVRTWREVGLTVDNAGDSQALIQLKKVYCDRRDCLRCRIGYEYLKSRK
ncbi:MAG: DUF2851 family protein [Prevotella sp.]|nr:DUF2851 family protein [Prevotella sp.]